MAPTDGDVVKVHYRGTLDDGTEFDTSYGDQPLEFTLGGGEVISGFEDAVRGLDVGQKRTVDVEPENAYGERVDEAVQRVPKEAFAEEPMEGGVVTIEAPDGNRMAATITKVDGEEVELDFNHPLAGQTLRFEVELVGVS